MDKVNKLLELRKAATQGEWNFGRFTIYDEDRPAQKRGEPYWTFEKSEAYVEYLVAAKDQQMFRELESIISPTGYDAEGLDIGENDAAFIIEAANNAEEICNAFTELESQLKLALECIEFYASENSWYLLETTASIITDEDLRDDKDSVKRIAGGKLAIETLKKLRGL